MKALVIGAGIGGPVVAAALHRAGLEAEVFETHPGPAEYRGLFLSLAVNGMRVLKDLRLLAPVLAVDVIPTPYLEMISTTGKKLGRVPAGWLDEATPSVTLMRGALQAALARAVRDRGVSIEYGKQLVGLAQDAHGVVARFADGSEARGDVLIGADGIRSRVRSLTTPEAPAPSFTGLVNVGGVVQSDLAPTPDAMVMVWGRRAFFGYTVRPNGEAWWFANVGSPREPALGELTSETEKWRAGLSELFADDPPYLLGLVGATERIGAWPIHDLPHLPAWHTGRVALLGDAAHAVSPSSGQGASLACEDAVVLARCLRDIGTPEAALRRYEQLRRPRAERIVAEGRKRGKYKALESRFAVRVRDAVMPLAIKLFASDKALAWINDYHVEWEERVAA